MRRSADLVPGPDFPTGAEIITPRADILAAYRTGLGNIRLRAAYEYDNGDIIITALPYQVSTGRVIEQIAGLMQAKKLPMVADIRDESDHEDPIRLRIMPRSNRVDKDVLMSHLLATTELEKSYRLNVNVIGLNRRPQTIGLVELLRQWLDFRRQTVLKRLQHRLEQINDRLHILEGLLIVFLHLDEVIRIIRQSDDPQQELMRRFKLSEIQVEAILSIRLRQLARLEELKLKREKSDLEAEKKEIEGVLASERRLKSLIKRELQADAEKFGDERRTRIVERREAQAIKEKDLAPVDPVTVVLSANGWVRAAKGHDIDPEGLAYKPGRRVPERGARPLEPGGRVHGLHRPHLLARGAQPALGPRPGRAHHRALRAAARRPLRLGRDRRGNPEAALGERLRLRLRHRARQPAEQEPEGQSHAQGAHRRERAARTPRGRPRAPAPGRRHERRLPPGDRAERPAGAAQGQGEQDRSDPQEEARRPRGGAAAPGGVRPGRVAGDQIRQAHLPVDARGDEGLLRRAGKRGRKLPRGFRSVDQITVERIEAAASPNSPDKPPEQATFDNF